MYATASEDDMVECPYNKYHRMARKRLQPHLIKCRLSYPNAELLSCPFNASHLVPEPEFTHHVTNCPDKALITQYKYNAVPLKIDEDDRKQVEVDCDENWDETEATDYDPKKYSSQANIIRTHIGDLPSARKEFRKNERKRLGDYHSSDEEEDKKKDLDSMKKEETREEKWYEDREASSSFKSSTNRRESYTESLKEYKRDRRDDPNKRPIKREKADNEEYAKRARDDAYPLDEDPYYKTNNTRPQYSSPRGDRNTFLGISRGASRKQCDY